MDQASKSPLGGTRTTARAFFVSERLNASGLERGDVLSTTPLAFRVNQNSGVAILFRYGVVVLIGLNALDRLDALGERPLRMPRFLASSLGEITTCAALAPSIPCGPWAERPWPPVGQASSRRCWRRTAVAAQSSPGPMPHRKPVIVDLWC